MHVIFENMFHNESLINIVNFSNKTSTDITDWSIDIMNKILNMVVKPDISDKSFSNYTFHVCVKIA